MPDVSPTKWHRAHTSWFFETFLLQPSVAGYRAFHPAFAYLFNSYYEGVGARYPRPQRGIVSRPGVAEVAEYRAYVDRAMTRLLGTGLTSELSDLVELGLHHEQQHQELLLMDIKHVLSCNPLQPSYRTVTVAEPATETPVRWIEHDGGLVEVGHDGAGFAFDNESPRHAVHLEPFALADRAVTCGEWMAFIADGGYQRPDLWLSDGWATAQADAWEGPLYWFRVVDDWWLFTLGGPQLVDPAEPVCHVSYYEADAFARWSGARLPTESEWEAVTLERSGTSVQGRFLDTSVLHPRPADGAPSLFGDVWQWTSSAYSPYPGFQPAAGAVGEYNGKFMVNQYVLRGGSCVTPLDHVRVTYRNFFPPSARWAFSGLRLTRDS
jgi:ergothioneine biosynthesis protein EgtB